MLNAENSKEVTSEGLLGALLMRTVVAGGGFEQLLVGLGGTVLPVAGHLAAGEPAELLFDRNRTREETDMLCTQASSPLLRVLGWRHHAHGHSAVPPSCCSPLWAEQVVPGMGL